MIQIGDRVTHKVFPPIDGIVVGMQPIVNSDPQIAVKRDDNGLLIWGVSNEWEVLEETDIDNDIIDVNYIELD